MALQRDTYYPGRYSTGDAAHPQGAFKNRTTPTSQDGSYLEKDWLNDWDGFFASLLDEAGITPDDSIDEVGASQYYDAMKAVFNGKIQKFTASGTFIVPGGVTKIYITAAAAGGGGGGGLSSTTSGGGGGGGACIVKEVYSVTPEDSISITIGAGGTGGAVNTNGGNGGNTIIGSLVDLRGGTGGSAGSGGAGQPGGDLASPGAGSIGGVPGDGGANALGVAGSRRTHMGQPGYYGGGGSGGYINAAGGAGGAGVVIIEW